MEFFNFKNRTNLLTIFKNDIVNEQTEQIQMNNKKAALKHIDKLYDKWIFDKSEKNLNELFDGLNELDFYEVDFNFNIEDDQVNYEWSIYDPEKPGVNGLYYIKTIEANIAVNELELN